MVHISKKNLLSLPIPILQTSIFRCNVFVFNGIHADLEPGIDELENLRVLVVLRWSFGNLWNVKKEMEQLKEALEAGRVEKGSFYNQIKQTLPLPFGKLTWQWKMDLLKMYSLLNMGIFHCHVSLLEAMYQWQWPLDFVEKGLWKRICFLGLDSSWRRGCRCFQSTPIKSAEDDAH